jgi:predicted kinase
MTGGRILLVTGPPGSGKSTLARELARAAQRGAHLDADALQALLVSGRARRGSAPDEEVNAQIDLRWANLVSLAANYADAGFLAVIDDALNDRARLMSIVEHLAPRRVHLVVCTPPVETALARDAARDQPVAHRWRHLYTEVRDALSGLGLHLDTDGLTVQQSVAQVTDSWLASLLPLPAQSTRQGEVHPRNE